MCAHLTFLFRGFASAFSPYWKCRSFNYYIFRIDASAKRPSLALLHHVQRTRAVRTGVSVHSRSHPLGPGCPAVVTGAARPASCLPGICIPHGDREKVSRGISTWTLNVTPTTRSLRRGQRPLVAGDTSSAAGVCDEVPGRTLAGAKRCFASPNTCPSVPAPLTVKCTPHRAAGGSAAENSAPRRVPVGRGDGEPAQAQGEAP